MRSYHFLAAVLLLLTAPATAQARDLVIYSEPTLEPALRSVGALWRAKHGQRVNVFVARTEMSLAQIQRGSRCDVLVGLAGEATDDAAEEKILKAETLTPVLRNALVLVSRDAVAGNDLVALTSGKRLAIADPARDPAGTHGLVALKLDPESPNLAVAESSAGVLDMLDHRKADLGLVYASDAAARPDLKVVAPVDAQSHPAIDYVAAEAMNAQTDTRGFIAFLKSAEARALFVRAGLRPVDK